MSYDNYDVSLDEYRSDLNRLDKKATNDNKFLLPPKEPGVLVVRLCPPATGEKLYCSTRLHYINGRNYHCTRSLQNGKWRGECRICDHYNGLYDLSKVAKSEDEKKALIAAARAIKPVERNYWNAIARKWFNPATKETEINVGPMILPMGKTLQGKVLRAIFGDESMQEPALGNVVHPLKGRDFKIVTTIKVSPDGKYPDYGESKFLDISPLGTEPQIEDWLGKLHLLRALRDDHLKPQADLQREIDILTGKIQDTGRASSEAVNEVSHEAVVTTTPNLSSDEDTSVVEDDFIRELQATLGKK